MPSFCPPRIRVGTLSVERFWEGEKGASPMPARRAGMCSVAYITPPPPIEWPITESRPGSISPRTGLAVVSQCSAERASCPRAASLSPGLLVSMHSTTNPKEEIHGPIQISSGAGWFTHRAVYPGMITRAPQVPWLVSVG